MTEPERPVDAHIAGLLGVSPGDAWPGLERLVGSAVDRGSVQVSSVAFVSGSPATASLQRVSGTTSTGHPWRLFVKLLQHGRHWPVLATMPPDFAAAFIAEFPWRDELRLWDPRIQASLPGGLRSPRLAAAIELPDDHVALWTEDVQQDHDASWDLARFAAAAGLLGRWNARSTSAEVLAVSPFPAGHGLRMYAERSVPMRGLAPLADDSLWQHPWLVAHHDLRRRQLELAARIPEFLERLDQLPQCLPHGDASPQNLLVPEPGPQEPAELVVIDVSFGTPHAVGFDLGQLLVGLVHAGELPAAGSPEVAEVIVPAYVEGAAAEGLELSVDTVQTGFALSALLRSGFDSLPWFMLGADTEQNAHVFAERVALERALVDLATSTL